MRKKKMGYTLSSPIQQFLYLDIWLRTRYIRMKSLLNSRSEVTNYQLLEMVSAPPPTILWEITIDLLFHNLSITAVNLSILWNWSQSPYCYRHIQCNVRANSLTAPTSSMVLKVKFPSKTISAVPLKTSYTPSLVQSVMPYILVKPSSW